MKHVAGAPRGAGATTPMKPGDYVVLRVAMDCVVAMSACPQDILPINGRERAPTEAHHRIPD